MDLQYGLIQITVWKDKALHFGAKVPETGQFYDQASEFNRVYD